MHNCIFILPYFGKFNNYFEIFLKTCERNSKYNWLIFTDDKRRFNYPKNVRVEYISFFELVELFKRKISDSICLEKPYKLCDFKPTYGYVFDEYIKGYEYWGHCDCDVLFGDLDKMLTPLLADGYDKLFPAGHLTIYKNTYENNRRFMTEYKGKILYKDFLFTPEICWFDEDWKVDNIHTMFLRSGCNVFPEMLAFNPSGEDTFFVQRNYYPNEHKYEKEKYRKSLLLWDNGHIYRYSKIDEKLVKEEYLYLHLQHRMMKQLITNVEQCNCIRILPERFLDFDIRVDVLNDLRRINLEPITGYLYKVQVLKKRIERKIGKLHGGVL